MFRTPRFPVLLLAPLLGLALPAPAQAGPPPALHDLAYGPAAEQRLDVYAPDHARRAPILIMVHGGGWRRGDKDSRGVVENKVAHWLPRGWIVVSVDYRMLPEADPLTQADDVAHALAYVQREAANWGGDPARVVMMGHSAGAHLVALLAADASIAARAGARPVRGTVALDSAAYDVDSIMSHRHVPLYDQAFGSDPAYWHRASPVRRIAGTPAPLLLVCSSARQLSCPNAQEFARAAHAHGGRAEILPLALNHMQINAELGADRDYTRRVDAFLDSL